MKFMPTLRVAALAASLLVAQRALALTVFDPMNYAQNVVTAAKAVRGRSTRTPTFSISIR